MSQNIAYTSIKFLVIDLIGDFLFWPIWWYTKGLVKTGLFCIKEIKDQQERLGLSIWIKNIFTPMFGQYDMEGRIISFFARLIQIMARTIILGIWSIFMLILFLLWITLPVIIMYQLYENLIWLVN